MEDPITTFHPKHFIEECGLHGPHPNHSHNGTCIICEKWISSGSIYFYCRECNIFFHKECPSVLMESNLTIDYPKTHEHTLTFIRKKNCFNCDACGTVGYDEMNMYACLSCNFFIHRRCIYLPKVVKLTRHSHRLLHTFQLPDCNMTCRLCNEPFVYRCGGYICIDMTCDYKLHSYCATGKGMWDGKDLEREPEEITNSEDVTFSSLQDIDGKTFRHFSHHHDLVRLCVNGNEKEEDEDRVCQACILHIDFDSFLCCKECDFALHETCANLPRKLEHPFHRHRLTLEVDMMNIKQGFFTCSKCYQESCGFMYRCCQEECEFKMDTNCASLTDPLHNRAHEHPLTLLETGACCYTCSPYLHLEPKRATRPVLLKYKCDTHPLTLCFAESIPWSHPSLRACEICEVIISVSYPEYRDVYDCTDCCTTLHADCAIGKYPYLKPGCTIKVNGFEIEIARNSLSRAICHACHTMCQDKLVFKSTITFVTFCSINCIRPSPLVRTLKDSND